MILKIAHLQEVLWNCKRIQLLLDNISNHLFDALLYYLQSMAGFELREGRFDASFTVFLNSNNRKQSLLSLCDEQLFFKFFNLIFHIFREEAIRKLFYDISDLLG